MDLYEILKSRLLVLRELSCLLFAYTTSWFFIRVLNSYEEYNSVQLWEVIEKRPRDQPLITVANHHSFIDPYVIARIVRFRNFYTYLPRLIKNGQSYCFPWYPGAREICFSNPYSSAFHTGIRVIPVDRGAGIHQQSMDVLLDKLNNGEWVHIFPEGKLNRTHERLEYKKGVARLITECKVRPIVIPIYLTGTDEALPCRKPNQRFLCPHIGKKITVHVGDPVRFDEVLEKQISKRIEQPETWNRITDNLHSEIDGLAERAERFKNLLN